mmetsp:Transcript_62687/g.99398  ORF Transcript_62687/g.99398 Transcript_62687/m.99398 type:complete len:99 (+) Transcript_62687:2119-2415(+)
MNARFEQAKLSLVIETSPCIFKLSCYYVEQALPSTISQLTYHIACDGILLMNIVAGLACNISNLAFFSRAQCEMPGLIFSCLSRYSYVFQFEILALVL